MIVRVTPIPRDLKPADVAGLTVVVFDVLRATTTMAAMLAAGVAEIRVFASLEAAKTAAEGVPGRILCGEMNCLPPPGFDRGNSPREWSHVTYAGEPVFMATTNGTVAIAAAAAFGPGGLLIGALTNARAAARAAVVMGRDITLLCAGTNGEISLEDMLGAGAVAEELVSRHHYETTGDAAVMARQLFATAKGDLQSALRQGKGGKNLIRAGLAADIDACAALNSVSVVGLAGGQPLFVRACP